MKKLFAIFNWVIFFLILAIAFFLLGTKFAFPGNFQVKIVQSGSMEPTIPTGSIVIIKPQPDYGEGSIITFGEDSQSDVPITHRVIGVNDAGDFITQGDANDDPDPLPVSKRDVIGEVIIHIPYLGYVIDFARKPLGFVLLIVIPAFVVIVDEIIIIFKEVARIRKKKHSS